MKHHAFRDTAPGLAKACADCSVYDRIQRVIDALLALLPGGR